jgi:hypothetical protein
MNWRRSSYSGQSGGNCVEVADDGSSSVIVRDSKDQSGPPLRFPAGAWRKFAKQLKSLVSTT